MRLVGKICLREPLFLLIWFVESWKGSGQGQLHQAIQDTPSAVGPDLEPPMAPGAPHGAFQSGSRQLSDL